MPEDRATSARSAAPETAHGLSGLVLWVILLLTLELTVTWTGSVRLPPPHPRPHAGCPESRSCPRAPGLPLSGRLPHLRGRGHRNNSPGPRAANRGARCLQGLAFSPGGAPRAHRASSPASPPRQLPLGFKSPTPRPLTQQLGLRGSADVRAHQARAHAHTRARAGGRQARPSAGGVCVCRVYFLCTKNSASLPGDTLGQSLKRASSTLTF